MIPRLHWFPTIFERGFYYQAQLPQLNLSLVLFLSKFSQEILVSERGFSLTVILYEQFLFFRLEKIWGCVRLDFLVVLATYFLKQTKQKSMKPVKRSVSRPIFFINLPSRQSDIGSSCQTFLLDYTKRPASY